jgi:hypothetical protein
MLRELCHELTSPVPRNPYDLACIEMMASLVDFLSFWIHTTRYLQHNPRGIPAILVTSLALTCNRESGPFIMARDTYCVPSSSREDKETRYVHGFEAFEAFESPNVR